MRIKDAFVLAALSLTLGWAVVESKPTTTYSSDTIKQVVDTIKQDTVVSVKGKKALFIGD
jgi:hypothetical protein